MTPLLRQFLTESRDLIQEATEGLLTLERDPSDAAPVDIVFRAFHTLKGSSGLFDVPPMTAALHAAEDALAEVRAGRLAVDTDLADILLTCLDHTGRWLNAMEGEGTLPPDAWNDAEGVVARLRGRIPTAAGERGGAAEGRLAGGGKGGGDGLSPVDRFAERDRMAALGAWLGTEGDAVDAALFSIVYVPDPRCFFNGDDPLRLMENLTGLAALDIEEREPWPAPGELDPFTCNLELRALVVGTGSEMRDVFRFVADQVRIVGVEPASLIRPQGHALAASHLRAFADGLGRRLDAGETEAVRRDCSALSLDLPPGSLPASALRWLHWLLDAPGVPRAWIEMVAALLAIQPEDRPAGGGHDPASRVRADLVRALVAEQRRLLEAGDGDAAEFTGRLGAAATAAINALLHAGRNEEARSVEAAYAVSVAGATAAPFAEALDALVLADTPARTAVSEDAGPDGDSGPDMATGRRAGGRALRVDEARVDGLMTLVGEMIAANNRLGWLMEQVGVAEGAPGGSDDLLRGMTEVHGRFERLTRQMHGAVVQIRMLPIGQTFQRFPRLVRDLSRRLGKSVDLALQGEETEADKAVIDTLFEPLLHLVRNSLDHGIEPPDERRATGKPPVAALILRAWRDGDQVVVEVSDDGRGIDAAAVRRKAVANRLIDPGQAQTMPDEEAIRLIFAPGFSTLDTVSDLSGRGIGMYAVRAAAEKAGGSVDVRSRSGIGTSVSLRLPLSMAVMRIVVAAVGRHRFGIPIDVVSESVWLRRDRIARFGRHDTFVLRDRIVPLYRLKDLLNLPGEDETVPVPADSVSPGDEVRVLVVETDGNLGAVEVDGFGERIDIVLKPMEGLLADIPGYLGTTVLGDGQVLLVLDLKEILR